MVEARVRRFAVGAAFWLYAVAAFLAARWAAHQVLPGWWAKLGTMALIAGALAPWGRWLAPRLTRVLAWLGWWILVGCYWVCLPLLALAARVTDPLRRRHTTGSRWLPHRELTHTLEAARLEY
jgi:hypothetical protein